MDKFIKYPASGGGGASTITGEIRMWGGDTAPDGWLLCDRSAYSATTYPDLFATIGYNFGGGGGTFLVPDFRGRAPIGAGSAPGLTARTIGGTGGSETGTYTVDLGSTQNVVIDNMQPFSVVNFIIKY